MWFGRVSLMIIFFGGPQDTPLNWKGYNEGKKVKNGIGICITMELLAMSHPELQEKVK